MDIASNQDRFVRNDQVSRISLRYYCGADPSAYANNRLRVDRADPAGAYLQLYYHPFLCTDPRSFGDLKALLAFGTARLLEQLALFAHFFAKVVVIGLG